MLPQMTLLDGPRPCILGGGWFDVVIKHVQAKESSLIHIIEFSKHVQAKESSFIHIIEYNSEFLF